MCSVFTLCHVIVRATVILPFNLNKFFYKRFYFVGFVGTGFNDFPIRFLLYGNSSFIPSAAFGIEFVVKPNIFRNIPCLLIGTVVKATNECNGIRVRYNDSPRRYGLLY